ncbi:MAG: D-2-hydroxyacid dehydrogenase [Burkholderiales bacterium]
MQKIVFLDRDTLAPQIVLRRPRFEHEIVEYARTEAHQVVERLAGAGIAILNKVRLTAAALERLPDLKLVAVAATGTDCVDKAYCASHGIAVSNIRSYAVNTVPEHTFALILALRRNVVAYRADVLAGKWQAARQFCFFDHPIRDLAGSRLGIIGEGVLGQRVADIARAFGMVPMFAAHKGVSGLGPLYTPWDTVLETSDVITLHSPLTPQTRLMIGDREFAAMKRKPLLVNTARGGLVDEEALVRALDEGRIAGAGFDVASEEPPSPSSPLMRIADRPNVIVTPHVAWASDEAQQALADQLMDNIENFVAGKPTNLVEGTF